jgi:hypothetical protein
VGAEDDAQKADKPEQDHHPDQGQKRQSAALPRRLRRPEKSIREDDKGNRIERRGNALMQFRAIFAVVR